MLILDEGNSVCTVQLRYGQLRDLIILHHRPAGQYIPPLKIKES